MSYHSNYPQLVQHTLDLFDADAPLSAYRSYILRSNLQQLIDQQGQYRVNWVADTNDGLGEGSSSGPSVATAADEYLVAHVVPVSIIQAEHPMNLDIRVAARISGLASASSVVATLLPFSGVASATLGEPLWVGSGVSTSTTASWVIDETFEWADYDLRAKQGDRRFISRDATDTRAGTGLLTLLQLVVRLTGTFTGTGEAIMCGLQVREYP